jgi:hypothetical protein
VVERAELLAAVERKLGNRQLVWAGLRGDDIEPLADLPQLAASFSIVGAYRHRSGVESVAYEDLTGVRVDPEVWDIDDHHDAEATIEFRRGLLRLLGRETALLPYRPSPFLSAIHFARHATCVNLGIFGGLQSALEHKPWVETAVAQMGIPRIAWTYVADEDQLSVRELARSDAWVLRKSRTSGGQGFTRISSLDELSAAWPKVDESFVSVAPFLDGGIPVNIGATVWNDGVTVHHPSVQLIGIESCVTREFGYCGNDFGAARDLDHQTIDQIEQSTRLIGAWLRRHGFLGSFGVDFLVRDRVPLFTEVNPRFQGSTHASCRLSIEAGQACLMLEHLAAWLGLPCPDDGPLKELVAATSDFANLVVHCTGDVSGKRDALSLADQLRRLDPSSRGDVVTPVRVTNEPGSVAARFTTRRRLTNTGFDLASDVDGIIASWQRSAALSPGKEPARGIQYQPDR